MDYKFEQELLHIQNVLESRLLDVLRENLSDSPPQPLLDDLHEELDLFFDSLRNLVRQNAGD